MAADSTASALVQVFPRGLTVGGILAAIRPAPDGGDVSEAATAQPRASN